MFARLPFFCKITNFYEQYLIPNSRIHEGNWIKPLNNKFCWPECEYYEQAQQIFGDGLDLIEKEYDEINHCTSFHFKLPKYLLLNKIVVPATGEELYFKIYGIHKSGNKELLIDMEL